MSVDTMQALSAVLRGQRRELALSQAAVAARAGVSRKFVSDAEAGKDTVEIGRLLALLDALGLNLDLVSRSANAESPARAAAEGARTSGSERVAAPLPDLDHLISDYLAGDG